MHKLGLIGYPLSHSWSPQVFDKFFKEEGRNDISYELFPLKKIKELPALIKKHTDLKGFNVTIPHKRDVTPYLTEIDPLAAEAGAVNTVVVIRSGKSYGLKGYNTDIYGFSESLHGRKFRAALILGNGGASRALKVAFRTLDIPYTMVSRTPGKDVIHWRHLDRKTVESFDLIVNTTPLGTAPEIKGIPPFPMDLINEKHFVYDLIYNPEKTRFLASAEKRGAEIKNGLEMLSLQAIQSWDIFKKNL